MKKIILLLQAQEELDKIYDPLFSDIIQRIECLRDYPEWGHTMAGQFFGYRTCIVGLFRIVYKILPNEDIEIAYIRHCRRDLKI